MVIYQKHSCPLALHSLHQIRNCTDHIFIMKSDSLRSSGLSPPIWATTTFLKSQELYYQVPIIRGGDKVVISQAVQEKGFSKPGTSVGSIADLGSITFREPKCQPQSSVSRFREQGKTGQHRLPGLQRFLHTIEWSDSDRRPESYLNRIYQFYLTLKTSND